MNEKEMNNVVRKDVMRKLVYGLFKQQIYDIEHGATIRTKWSYETPQAKHWIEITHYDDRYKTADCRLHSEYSNEQKCLAVAPPWCYIDGDTDTFKFAECEHGETKWITPFNKREAVEWLSSRGEAYENNKGE